MTRKVVVTETLTAEVVTEEISSPRTEASGDPAYSASEDLGTLAMAAGTSLGASMLGLFQGAALAAHGAAHMQTQGGTALEASTVQGLTHLYKKSRRSRH